MGVVKGAAKAAGTLAALEVLVRVGMAVVSVALAVQAIKALTREDNKTR